MTDMTRGIAVGVFVLACGFAASASEQVEPAAKTMPVTDAGAGSIVRNDPAIDALVPVGARIEKLHDGFVFIEGPVWVQQGEPYLLFSDVQGNVIHKWTPDGELSDFMNPVFEGGGPSAGSNGLTRDAEGRLIVMEHGRRQVTRIEADGTHTVLADRYDGKRLNSPNDAAYRSDGWLYFTDPPYGLPQQDEDPAKELEFSGIYRLGPDGELELLNRDQSRPNGIAFSPDETTLYVANSDAKRKVWMAYDVADGTHLGTIQPEEVPANVAWGDDGRTLYMTARTGLYRIVLSTQGMMP